MKGTICLAALAVLLGLQSASRADDGDAAEQSESIIESAGWGYQPPYDRFSAPPPMGLRYMTPGVPYRYGMGAVGGPANACGACGNGGNGGIATICIDWALLPWYASWRFGCQAGCGGRRGGACCNNQSVCPSF